MAWESIMLPELLAALDGLGMTRGDSDHASNYNDWPEGQTQYQLRATILEIVPRTSTYRREGVRFEIHVKHRLPGVSLTDRAWTEVDSPGSWLHVSRAVTDWQFWDQFTGTQLYIGLQGDALAERPRTEQPPARLGNIMSGILTAHVECEE